MNASAFDAAVQSVAGFGSAASAHVAAEDFGVTIPALHVEQLLLVFLGAFAWGILKYLTEHPVAAMVPEFEDALGRLNQELQNDSLKNKGSGGNVTESRSAGPTAAPAH